MPSIAAERMPPANPAPSPAGNNPGVLTLSRVVLCLGRRTGEEVLVSTPVITAPAIANPGIDCSNTGRASRIASSTGSGKQPSRLVNVTPGA
jgi:hypothetical protein